MAITVFDGVLVVTYFILLFLAIFWLLVLFSPEEKLPRKRIRSHLPLFSVIVPAYNEETSIPATLQSLVNLDYPAEKIEIVVVNDGSTDNTKEVVRAFISTHQQGTRSTMPITLITQPNRGKGSAMNRGLAEIKGKYFACLDADSFIHRNALQAMLPELEADEEVAAICPVLKVQAPRTVLQKVQWCEYIVNMFYKYLNARLHCIHVTPGPFSVYRTEIIKRLGGFNEQTITEDLEIAIRLQKHQYQIRQSFDTIVETVAPTSWKELFRQRVRWYKGSVDNTLAYKDLIFNVKYGDFGMIRMPTMILGGALAIILTLTLGHAFLTKAVHAFQALYDIHFDLLTLIKNTSFSWDLLSWPFFKIVIALTLMAISFFVMIKAFTLVKEKIASYGKTWVSMATYLLIYSFFLTTVWLYITYIFIRGKKNRW